MLSGYVAWDTCLLVALNLRRCGQNRLVHILAGEICPIFSQCFWFKIRMDSRTTQLSESHPQILPVNISAFGWWLSSVLVASYLYILYIWLCNLYLYIHMHIYIIFCKLHMCVTYMSYHGVELVRIVTTWHKAPRGSKFPCRFASGRYPPNGFIEKMMIKHAVLWYPFLRQTHLPPLILQSFLDSCDFFLVRINRRC